MGTKSVILRFREKLLKQGKFGLQTSKEFQKYIIPLMARCMYSIQHYVIKFVSDLRQVGGFLEFIRILPPIKLKYC
jgi:hypothetical protein